MIEIGKKYFLLVLTYEVVRTKAEFQSEDNDDWGYAEYGHFLKSVKILEQRADRLYAGKGSDPKTIACWERRIMKNRMVFFSGRGEYTGAHVNILANNGDVIRWDSTDETEKISKKPSVILFFTKKAAIKKLLSIKEELMKYHWAYDNDANEYVKEKKEKLEKELKRLSDMSEAGKLKRMEKTSELMKKISKYEEELQTA